MRILVSSLEFIGYERDDDVPQWKSRPSSFFEFKVGRSTPSLVACVDEKINSCNFRPGKYNSLCGALGAAQILAVTRKATPWKLLSRRALTSPSNPGRMAAQYFFDVMYSLANCLVCFPSTPQLKINSRSFKMLRLLGEVGSKAIAPRYPFRASSRIAAYS